MHTRMALICFADETAGEWRERAAAHGHHAFLLFLKVAEMCKQTVEKSLLGQPVWTVLTNDLLRPGAGKGLPRCKCLGPSQAADEMCSPVPPTAIFIFTLGSTIWFRHLVFHSFSQARNQATPIWSPACCGGLGPWGCENPASLHSALIPPGSDSLLAFSAGHGFPGVPPIHHISKVQWPQAVDLLALHWGCHFWKLFGDEKGCRMRKLWMALLFHFWPTTYWVEKVESGQAGVTWNCLKTSKMVANMIRVGEWETSSSFSA